MNKRILLFLLAFFASSVICQAQNAIKIFNLGLEKTSSSKQLPDDWFKWGSDCYSVVTDTIVKHSGKKSVLIFLPATKTSNTFGCAALQIPAIYEGNVIELKAFMKMENVNAPVGLMLRIDGTTGSLQFDNMQQKNIQGTSDWTQYSVKYHIQRGLRASTLE